ncbi:MULTISPECIES: type I restriction endonuclease subunit R [Nitrosomonas]|uniref:Type I restriction enzyme endonuclease subunit n=1 Tax=Nitrosomonas europaea (strain ATCC 19718 / CIP 103999 / KCTC 2705 / NBRC 14298) TaxID=228410 RepID=Q82XA5_NITEU|nr:MULTISPECIES: type I restriction endonuclease subunit R [Nitrosomonas]CAD84293.1 Restriction enzymes type I helicase subunits and related helicases [Nitrosomonas europaea ATCC 19718]SDW35431.1 type I restriction enzyme, R subunit [Nitrosomonas europaea]SES94090.1 type I restriction enzyme, R subunit [Nitrosomonas europaea]SJZ45522.1 type I restriction enzyme, R subunit [Nitrosomonas europaea]HBF26088.1 type I restriction endonuclease subunit R [Nitrosomonas sp.]
MITEQKLEDTAVGWFAELGWPHANGPEIAPDGDQPARTDYRQVVLREHLLAALARINPHIPAAALEQAAHELLTVGEPLLIARNRRVHRLLLSGIPVEFSVGDEKRSDLVNLIDFANPRNNDFLLVSQFTVRATRQPRRPDLVAFVNGLPLVVIELKNPANEQTDIWDALNQIQTYKEEIGDLFNTNVAVVVSDGFTARLGSLTANQERMQPWRAIANEDDRPLLEFELETLVRGFFEPALFLDYVRHFVLFEQDADQIIKKIAGYHQFHAVREAVKATVIAASNPNKGLLEVQEPRATYGKEVQPGSRKAGVVWHTQGSGKSITMACYAGKLLQQPEMKNPTLVVVTDRNDLDGQLFATFCAAEDLLRQTPVQAGSREELREILASREAGGIIFTTVQKFALLDDEEQHPLLSDRSNIVVISDEAHRSQYGMKGRLDTKTGKYVFGYAKHMRDALANATFIGFTGTPIALEDKDTRAVFGDYVSIYDIQDAVDDGATVPIFYESRLAKLDVNQAEIDALNAQVDEVIEDEEDITAREKTKSDWAALTKLVGAQPRLEQVAADLVQHFETRTATLEGKVMIVCMSRDICAELYNATVALRPDWHDADPEKGAIKVVMTGSAADKPLLQPHLYSQQVKKLLEKRFKDPADPLKLVIVRDMWLTGFDAPCCHTMYVDKPMKGHNLMQAIARVNRVFRNKPGGLVVDYIGIANELKAALKTYTESKGKGDPTHNAAEALAVLLEKLDIVRGLMHGFDYRGFETDAMKLLVPVANHILGLKDGKQRFLDAMLAVSKAFSLCSTLDETAALRTEIAFFAAVKAAIVKFTTVDRKRSDADKNSALKQILDNAIVADGVADIFALAGLDKPNIGLLSEEFLEDVRQMKNRNLAVELLEKLLSDEIKARARNNVVQEKKYGDRLLETLRKYHNRAVETAQIIEELIQMAKDFQAALEREAALGLNPDEIAFYDALANNESAVRELGDDTLKKIAVEITEKLRNSTTVDWQVRESVRAKLRILVRRTLQKWKYPPDKQLEAVELVLQQAEVLSNSWSK